jgi:ribosome-binding protein aMBF1 (putative translation factor)
MTTTKSTIRRRRATRGTPASQVLDRITGKDPVLRAAIRAHKVNVLVSEMIYAARTAAGLSQAQLARRVGTTQSVISRLEDADYEGYSLTTLQRIAEALGQQVEVRMAPIAANWR